MQKTIYIILGAVLATLLLVASFTHAAQSVFSVFQGGTGTSTLPVSQLLYGSGQNSVQSVATSSESISSPLTGSAFTVVGTAGSIGCQTASGSQAGCLSSADWTTFNNKAGFAWPFSIAANGGVSTSTLMQFLGNASSTQESSTQAYFGGTATTTISSSGIGIGTSTPFASLSLDRKNGFASSTIAVNEYNYGSATSTQEKISCLSASQTHIAIGTSATTLTLDTTSLIPGQKCIVIVENPNAAAGAITWAITGGGELIWTGGSVPTQTTTANKMDVWSFLATMGSSTKAILGAQSANF